MSLDFEGHKLSEIYWKQKNSEFATLFQCFPCTLVITTPKQRLVELEKNPRFPTAVDAMEVEHALHVCEKLKSLQKTGKKAWKKDEKSYGFSLEKTVAKKPLGRNIPSN